MLAPKIAEIKPGVPLLVLGCSQDKRTFDAERPFVDVYNGMAWLILRKKGYPRSNIAAISGKLGYLAPGTCIETYDIENKDPDKWRNHPTLRDFRRDVLLAGSAQFIAGATYKAFGVWAENKYPELVGRVTYSPNLTIGKQARYLLTWLLEYRHAIR